MANRRPKLRTRQSLLNSAICSALDFNFERAVRGPILTVGKKLSLKNLNGTIRAIN